MKKVVFALLLTLLVSACKKEFVTPQQAEQVTITDQELQNQLPSLIQALDGQTPSNPITVYGDPTFLPKDKKAVLEVKGWTVTPIQCNELKTWTKSIQGRLFKFTYQGEQQAHGIRNRWWLIRDAQTLAVEQ